MSRLPGVIEADASYREGKVVVSYDPAAVSPDQMADAITDATYYTVGEPVPGGQFPRAEEATAGTEAVIRVEGMTDERAASLVTQAMGAVGPAVSDVSLNVAESSLTVSFNPEQVSAETLVDAINRGTEYQASLLSVTEQGGGTDYVPYILIGIFALFAAALALLGLSWGRRQLAGARAPASRATRRRERRGR